MIKKVIFITEGGAKIGLGHLMRCVAVAQQARYLGRKPFFIVNSNRITSLILKKYRFDFHNIEKIKDIKNAPVLIDSKRDVSDLVRTLQANGCLATLMDNNTNARLYADKIIYPFAHFNPRLLDWNGSIGKVYSGAKFFPLRKELKAFGNRNIIKKNNILISFGGLDPNGLTLKVLKALKNINQKLNIKVLIGPAFKKKHKDKIHKIVKDYPHRIVVIDNHLNFKGLLKDIGLCITALGVSLYEFNYFGIPVVLLCNYKKDKKDARILERLHIAVSLGYYRDTNLSEISRRINKILAQGKIKIKKYVDGKGARRILEKTLG